MAGPRLRILMVDDVARHQMLYEMTITDALPDSVVSFATNGEDALQALVQSEAFDLLILDLNMPKLGGEETLRRIRGNPGYDKMPIVILTGDSDEETHRRLLDAGADDFVEKGAPPEIFVARLKTQMRHKLALEGLTQAALDRDMFAAGVLHDVRNLETTISAICQLTEHYLETDPQQHAAQIAADFSALALRAEQLGRYAAEVIAMVRTTQRAVTLKSLDLAPIITWAHSLARSLDQGSALPDLELSMAQPLQAIVGDEHGLQLALLNILQNAIKYRRPDTTAAVHISQRDASADQAPLGSTGGAVVTCIRDFGQGIKAEELRGVFAPFVRGAERRKGDGGFGLGLALVSKVLHNMGGRVWAELPPSGPGTVICLALPGATTAAPAASLTQGASA